MNKIAALTLALAAVLVTAPLLVAALVVATLTPAVGTAASCGGAPAAADRMTVPDGVGLTAQVRGGGHAPLPGSLAVPGVDGRGWIRLDREQVGYAALAFAEATSHALPGYAAVAFLATAEAESGLRNLPYGDRDSVGLVQQRPSVGWGTRAQILTPKLTIDAFYGVATHTHNPGLVNIPHWQSRPLGEVSQAVQRSAFPDRYQHYQTTARAIVSALAGAAGGPSGPDPGCAGTSTVGGCPATGLPAERGLTPDALLVLRCALREFPKISTVYGVGRRGGVSDHPSGRAVDLMVPDYSTPAGAAYGWQLARWVRTNAAMLGVHYVIFSARIWNLDRDGEGWRVYRSVTGSDDDTSLHYDHVHVSVYGNKGTGPPDRPTGVRVTAGRWVMPLPPGRYRVGCRFGCYPGHAGQDFPAPSGTPVYSSSDGTVLRSVALLNADGSYRSYGNLVVIQARSAAGTDIYYAHLQQRLVDVGATVSAGQLVGLSGHTGHVTPHGEAGAHLHYEIRRNGVPTDPMPILRGHGVRP